MRHIFLILIFVIVAGCTQSNAINDSAADSQQTVPVRILELKPKRYQKYGEYLGTVRAKKEVKLRAYAGGTVKKIKVRSGDVVKKGQSLCDIDGEKMAALFESAKLAERVAKQKAKRMKIHLKSGSTSQVSADQAQMEYLKTKSQRVDARKNRDGALCISPISGVVVAKHIELFEDLNPGEPTFDVAQLDEIKVDIGIPETSIDGYKRGSPVLLTENDGSETTWEGKIYSIDQRVNEIDRTFRVEVLVDNTTSNQLKPGLTVRAKLLQYQLENQIVVPTQALVTLNNKRVLLVVSEGVANEREVVIKSSNERESLIASGVEFGEKIIVSGQNLAGDGTPIKVINN